MPQSQGIASTRLCKDNLDVVLSRLRIDVESLQGFYKFQRGVLEPRCAWAATRTHAARSAGRNKRFSSPPFQGYPSLTHLQAPRAGAIATDLILASEIHCVAGGRLHYEQAGRR